MYTSMYTIYKKQLLQNRLFGCQITATNKIIQTFSVDINTCKFAVNTWCIYLIKGKHGFFRNTKTTSIAVFNK